ncbi:MAG: hypothetical protein AB7T27_10260 [Kiritimatiellia bacterium]
MKTITNRLAQLIIFGLFLTLAACAVRYPMGLSREQWEALSPAAQAEYQAQQYTLDEQKRQAAAADRLAREQARQARTEAERARLAELYAQAQYGDIVRVAVQSGVLEIYGKRHPAQPVAFEIAKGESKMVSVTRQGQIQQSHDFLVRLSDDGNTLSFDADSAHPVVMVNGDWERGQKYAGPSAFQKGQTALLGAEFFVKYKELPGAPQRVIFENR